MNLRKWLFYSVVVHVFMILIFLDAQEPVQPPFEFHRPITSLKYLAAVCAVKPLLEVKDATNRQALKNELINNIITNHMKPKRRKRRLRYLRSCMDWTDDLSRFLSKVYTYCADDFRLAHAIRTNDTELLSLELPGIVKKEEFEKNAGAHKEAISSETFARLAQEAANLYSVPDKNSATLTAIEYLLAHARHIPQDTYDSFDLLSHYNLTNLLMYGGIIKHNSRQYVIEGGARGDFLNQWRRFPLHMAIIRGSLDAQGKGTRAENVYDYPAWLREYITTADNCPLGFIETNKVELDTRKRDEWWRAAEQDRYAAASAMLQGGADVNLQSKSRITPLHLATFYGASDLLSLLVEHGARVNVKDGRDFMPLHYAAKDCYTTDKARYLVEHGAVVDARDGLRKTPLFYAKWRDDAAMVALLKSHGAKDNSLW